MIRNIKTMLLFCLSGLFLFALNACNSSATNTETDISKVNENREISPTANETPPNDINEEQPDHPITISSEQFMQLVSDYHKKWKYKGEKPCVVDFYADWCRPCKMMEPAIEKMAKQYAGKVDFYKVDVDVNEDITNAYKIMGIPTLFFCSLDGELIRIPGALTEEQLIANIELIVEK